MYDLFITLIVPLSNKDEFKLERIIKYDICMNDIIEQLKDIDYPIHRVSIKPHNFPF